MKYCKHCGQEVDDDATFCPNCGSKIENYSTNNYTTSSNRDNSSNRHSHKIRETDGGTVGLGILSFFVPIVGLILFLAWKYTNPRYAKAAGIGAIIGAVIQLGLTLTDLFQVSFPFGFFGFF